MTPRLNPAELALPVNNAALVWAEPVENAEAEADDAEAP